LSLSFSAELARWVCDIRFNEIPEDVTGATKLRVLDVLGLAAAGSETDFGRSVRDAALAMGVAGPCRIIGTAGRFGITAAAFANGAFAQALEYDDTHNESIVHMSSPAVAAGLALSEVRPTSGEDLLTAIAVANEISCRVGSVSAGELHRRGFHPTGIFAPFGASYLACRLLELDADAMAHAAGIAGSFAGGLLECWTDGTESKFLHSGWAAQSGIASAFLARSGVTGPRQVFEGRFGLFASHVQDPGATRDFSRIAGGLGAQWLSRNSSFKPFPAAHVIHPYIDALLRLQKRCRFKHDDIARIDCPAAAFIVPIVCEPAAEKRAPASAAQARVSLPYTLAEALYFGRLGKDAYQAESLRHRGILELAEKVHHHVDPAFPGPGRFKGAVRVTLKNGSVYEEAEEYNRGSVENPMTESELRSKFDENVAGLLPALERDRLADAILKLETLEDASVLLEMMDAGRASSARRER